jgi:hypothetical protein
MRFWHCAVAAVVVLARPAPAFIEAPHTLGRICSESTNIVVVEVAKVDAQKNLIIFKVVEDLKGKHKDPIKHNIGQRGSHAREWQAVMAWAKVGQKAVFFHNGQASVTCIGTFWYQCFKEGDWWAMSHAEPYLLRSYCGDLDKLTPAVKDMLQGKEVVVPCLADGDVKKFHERTGKVQTMRASLKKLDYDPKRDVVQAKVGTMTNGVMDGSGKPAAVASKPAAPDRPSGVVRFYRAINLNGPAVTIDGQHWDAGTDAHWKVSGSRFENQKVALKPAPDEATARMLRSSVWGAGAEVTLKDVPKGTYVVYLHVWEDNDPEVFDVLLNGKKAVEKHNSGSAGRWSRLGPWPVEAAGGGITLKNGSATAANFSGVEVWRVERPTVPAGVPGKRPLPAAVKVDKTARTVTLPCVVAPRKLPQLNAVYPIEVIATYPTPDGQKAHETVVTFAKDIRPGDIHAALQQLGLKPGKPAHGEGETAEGPVLRIYLELPGRDGKARCVPVEQLLTDTMTRKPLPAFTWHFTGSAARQPDPEKNDLVYGADVTGTLITLFPVTDDTVIQGSFSLKDETRLKLETNKDVLPKEGTAVKLVIEAK